MQRRNKYSDNYWIHIPCFNYEKSLAMRIIRMMGFIRWLTFFLIVSVITSLRIICVYTFWGAHNKLGKVISKLLSRIKALEEFLNPICVMKSASLKVLELGKLCDNKGLTYRTNQRLQIKRASSIRIKLHQSLHQTDEEHDYENGTLE